MFSFESLVTLTAFLLSRFRQDVNMGGVPFYNPTLAGGSMLDDAGDGFGEPLNVIISGLSSPGVLTGDGIVNYARAIGFSEECFGLHLGGLMSANLGDGKDNSGIGTCLESLVGGNHFRVFPQNGASANSGALFLAVSQEEPATEHHDIVPDGYNIGRNNLVAAAVGETSFDGIIYYTTAENVTGLLLPGSEHVNHGIAQDGVVTLLTVAIKDSP
ncbi:hypothetical protein V8B97DRAFT_2021541 [Scleroderma yunnanense]